MKRVLTAVAACMALGAWGQPDKKPSQQPEPFDYDAIMKRLGTAPLEPTKPKLGPINQWRYESCQTDAAKAPTPQGVIQGMRVCREKFNQ